jgi:hypothetical protein
MAVGPIPRSAIRDYADEFGIVGDRFDEFHAIIRAMDSEYLTLTSSTYKGKHVPNTVSATDAEGVAQLFNRMRNRAATANRKQRKH